MAFVLLLVVSITTLVQVESQSAVITKHKLESEQAALLSLNMAIGKLQEYTGLDQRVTAPAQSTAGLPDEHKSKKLTGVWRAWEGLDHDQSTGLPTAPDYDSKLDMGELKIDSTNGGRFLAWLASSYEEAKNSGASITVESVPSLEEGTDTQPLLSTGTLGMSADAEDQVHIVPTTISDGSNAIAWWIQGENTKVRLKPAKTTIDDFEATEQMLVSPGPSGAGFDIDDTEKVDRAVSRLSLDLVANSSSSRPSEFFHDLSVSSRGLLTNTANGGWRRDLSLWSEYWDDVDEDFSAFTLSPGNIWTSGKFNRTSSNNPLIYPWSDWSSSPFQNSVSWAALADYATQYKQLNTSGNALAAIDDSTSYQKNQGNQQWEITDTVRRLPVVARVHTVISLSAKLDGTNYQPCVILNPVITMWNPYDVALDMSWRQNLQLNLIMGSPFSVRFDVNGTEQISSVNDIGVQSINVQIASPSSLWLPGEVRVFSPTGGDVIEDESTNRVVYEAGCDPTGGIRYNIPGLASRPGTETLSATEAVLQEIFAGPNVQGAGVYFTLKRASSRETRPPNSMNKSLLLDDLDEAREMLGDSLTLTDVSDTLLSLSTTPKPFLTLAMSMRFARDVNDQMENIVVNGIHNMNPTVDYMVSAQPDHNLTPLLGRFDVYPYNVLLFSVNSYIDPGMPSGALGDPEGFLGSGFSYNDGLSNLILTEIPTSPLRSIGDLQHFNVNKCNSWAPYTLNPLGNSRATPFIDSDKIRVSKSNGSDTNTTVVGHDHSYAINHLLLDDWFVSSVAPDPDQWSSTGGRTIEEVYTEHLSGAEALPNHYYQPTAEAAAGESGFSLTDGDAWQEVAAELEVDGMFNINSTSERAWAMLLKRNFATGDSGVLRLDSSTAGSGTATTSLEQGDGSPFPRSKLISDENAGGLGYSSLSKHQRFSNEQIEALAREIVDEIEKRGPFLSLSEFFNRQLSDDVDLAHAGAVESALLNLSETVGSQNPYTEIKASFTESDVSTNDLLGNSLDYPFPEAAEGNPAYGFPGWTRQADVLRPISGILSARDDTFTIRAYGDVRNPITNEVISRSWCEAVVQRKADYVDSSTATGDEKYTLPAKSELNSNLNERFGRRFEVIDFRWLNADEV
ncbi:MAG: hypothetical protein ACSHX8_05725 [Opitutaceae bacterium]